MPWDEQVRTVSHFLTPVVAAGALENGPFLSKTGRKGQGGLRPSQSQPRHVCCLPVFLLCLLGEEESWGPMHYITEHTTHSGACTVPS